MDYKKARKQIKKIKTLLDSFESLEEPITEMEARLLRKYADEFKKIIPHFEEEEEIVPVAQPKVESAIINLKGEIQEKELPKPPKEEVKEEEFDVPPVAEIVEEPVVEEVVELAAKKVEPVATKKVAPPKVKKPKKVALVAEHDEEEIGNISLWEPVKITELSQKLSFSPIKDILKSISLNERIFTQKELFNGDNLSFRATLEKLETMNTFKEASDYLRKGVAANNKWEDAKKIKKAKEFMRLVQRRFL
jgi:hypothetical protein